MPANKKTFEVYAHVRAARQTLGDRMEEIRKANDNDERLEVMNNAYTELDRLESRMERILRGDQVDE